MLVQRCVESVRAAWRVKAAAVMVVFWALVASPPAWACPRCQVGLEARAAVFQHGFWSRLGWVVAPFVVLTIVVSLLYRIGLKPRRAPQAQGWSK